MMTGPGGEGEEGGVDAGSGTGNDGDDGTEPRMNRSSSPSSFSPFIFLPQPAAAGIDAAAAVGADSVVVRVETVGGWLVELRPVFWTLSAIVRLRVVLFMPVSGN